MAHVATTGRPALPTPGQLTDKDGTSQPWSVRRSSARKHDLYSRERRHPSPTGSRTVQTGVFGLLGSESMGRGAGYAGPSSSNFGTGLVRKLAARSKRVHSAEDG